MVTIGLHHLRELLLGMVWRGEDDDVAALSQLEKALALLVHGARTHRACVYE